MLGVICFTHVSSCIFGHRDSQTCCQGELSVESVHLFPACVQLRVAQKAVADRLPRQTKVSSITLFYP